MAIVCTVRVTACAAAEVTAWKAAEAVESHHAHAAAERTNAPAPVKSVTLCVRVPAVIAYPARLAPPITPGKTTNNTQYATRNKINDTRCTRHNKAWRTGEKSMPGSMLKKYYKAAT